MDSAFADYIAHKIGPEQTDVRAASLISHFHGFAVFVLLNDYFQRTGEGMEGWNVLIDHWATAIEAIHEAQVHKIRQYQATNEGSILAGLMSNPDEVAATFEADRGRAIAELRVIAERLNDAGPF